MLGALIVMMMLPATGVAATLQFGSLLGVPATLNTANNLNYPGTGHSGADTALWNVTQYQGSPVAPFAGQVLSVTLEGCAQPAAGAPAPLTQIHFQSLTAQAGGSFRVNVTTQSFDIPICGAGGASGSTKTTYQPANFCVAKGDYVDFADEGGYTSQYPSGVPYQVIGSVPGSTMDSFIHGTTNGAVFSPGNMTPGEGFATNPNEEVMLQATLGTGADATPLCGGQSGSPTPTPTGPRVAVPAQRDGVNRSGNVKVGFRCQQSQRCVGRVTLTRAAGRKGKTVVLGASRFDLAGGKSGKVQVHLSARGLQLIRANHRVLRVLMSVALNGGTTVRATVTLKI